MIKPQRPQAILEPFISRANLRPSLSLANSCHFFQNTLRAYYYSGTPNQKSQNLTSNKKQNTRIIPESYISIFSRKFNLFKFNNRAVTGWNWPNRSYFKRRFLENKINNLKTAIFDFGVFESMWRKIQSSLSQVRFFFTSWSNFCWLQTESFWETFFPDTDFPILVIGSLEIFFYDKMSSYPAGQKMSSYPTTTAFFRLKFFFIILWINVQDLIHLMANLRTTQRATFIEIVRF